MNKKELSIATANKAGISKEDAAKAVDAVFEAIIETLASGEAVDIHKFAKFEPVETAGRVGRNPQTGEPVEISASRKVKIKQLKALKDSVK